MKLKLILICIVSGAVLTGCDWVKGCLGLPTSDEIARMEEFMHQEELRRAQLEQRQKDSAVTVQQPVEVKPELKRFHVILGCFREMGNADALAARLEKAGCSPVKIGLQNGFTMVASGGYDTYREAMAGMSDIEDDDNCPWDVWIYDSRDGLHI